MLKQNFTDELIKKFLNYIDNIEKEINNKNYKSALNLVDDAFKDIFRLGMKFFNSFTTNNLIEMVSTNRKSNTDRCIMMAKLLEEEGFILEKQNKIDESFYINKKSLTIFLDTYSKRNDYYTLGEYFNNIQNLIDNIFQYEIPVSLENKIKDYYISIGKYDKAENVFYYIMEESNYSIDSIKNALEFYNKLIFKEDSVLKEGGISKQEIQDSIQQLKSRL